MKRNYYLLDTNIIIRFLTKDNLQLSNQAAEIIKKIEKREIRAKITEGVLAEIVYVIMKIYKKDKQFTVDVLKKILNLKGIVNRDKKRLVNALNIFAEKNIDIIDAILTSRSAECLGVLSFDRDLREVDSSSEL